jgi:hypothetical protein
MLILDQVRDKVDENTRELQAQRSTASRLTDGMYAVMLDACTLLLTIV